MVRLKKMWFCVWPDDKVSRIKHEATIVLGEMNCDVLPHSKISVLHVYTNMFFKTLNNINLEDILKNLQL